MPALYLAGGIILENLAGGRTGLPASDR